MKILSTIKETLIERIKSPFWGVLIILIAFDNWKLIYSLFNFDKTENRLDKIQILEKYISENGNTTYIIKIIGLTLLAVAIGTLLNRFTVLIKLFFKRLGDTITEKILKNTNLMVSKEEYSELTDLFNNKRKENSELLDNFNKVKSDLSNSVPKSSSLIKALFLYLEKNELTHHFIANFEENDMTTSKNEFFNTTFIELNLIEFQRRERSQAFYKLNDIGSDLLEYCKKNG
ncbi:hypothetical protein [Winogradskyella immobilis]|uniref:Uncharacterized protein n=1 Tax=Winogradskyella immobilis TaxID=2816852 RepID=A0ABS8ER49_9FLAO|nr:hypothetical protein [Winogradskyella immobilis]MCC1485653.1 hypothetical protein [Winogradskyella immobilis]MCG0017746.1 hypothetical protein [Winogradskyella immobilis]